MKLCKTSVTNKLPIYFENYIIRERTRKDLDLICNWPDYEKKYEAFNPRMKYMKKKELDDYFNLQNRETNRINLVVIDENNYLTGYFNFIEIDWDTRIVHNMAIRVAPPFCNKGLGTKILQLISEWIMNLGIKKIKLDVAKDNTRAMRCYQKVGFKCTGEFNKNQHTFYWMESKNTRQCPVL